MSVVYEQSTISVQAVRDKGVLGILNLTVLIKSRRNILGLRSLSVMSESSSRERV